MQHDLSPVVLPVILAVALAPLSPGRAADIEASSGAPPVTREQCRALAAYRPGAGAAYTPGVDVHGKPVAPADLPDSGAGALGLPPVVEFDIKVNPFAYGSAAQGNAALGQTAFPVGHVAIDTRSGAVTLNGHPIGGDQQQALAEACRRAGF